jgi:hypothetical protein
MQIRVHIIRDDVQLSKALDITRQYEIMNSDDLN